MNRTLAVLLLAALPMTAAWAEPPMPTGPRLRQIVAENYPHGNVLIGATTGSWSFGTDQAILMDREFSYVTPENDFKQSVVHPTPTEWDWSRADAWVQHIRDNRQVLRIHGPISPQCSSWARDDARTPAELEQNMREFFSALCQRYNGVPGFEYIDVVNETVVGGQWHTDKPGDSWECPWYKIGVEDNPAGTPLYIRYAFEIAAEHAPDFRLVFNHHESPTRQASWNLIKDTVQELTDRGLPVHGIGWQAHVDVGWDTTANLTALSDLITWAHTHNLEFHITEQSVWIPDTSSESLEAQARTYRNIVEVLLQHRRAGLVTWNTWHISDAHGWKKEEFPSLFDTQYRPKPAYYALQELLTVYRDLRCDFNLDGHVNWPDLRYLTSWWLRDAPTNEPADLDATGHVDGADYALFSQQWHWLPLPGILAHWRLDEAYGVIARDSAGSRDGTVYGGSLWRPADGNIGGALEFDGTDDYVATPFVLDPAQNRFGVFAWIKGGAPGHVIISQEDGTGVGMNWLAAESSTGNFMTELKPPGRFGRPLISQTLITDSEWHHVGLVWDGSHRHLYVDEAEVATDTTSYEALVNCDGGLHFGTDKTLAASSFWLGLIDDIQVYSVGLTP